MVIEGDHVGGGTSEEGGASRAPSPWQWVWMAGLFYGVLAVVALAWRSGWMGEPIFFASAAGSERGVHWLADAGLGLFTAFLLVFLSRELVARTRSGEALARAMGRVLGALPVLHTTLLALMSGVAEELLFRGALQPQLGLVAASLLFGLAHFVPRREFLLWTAFAVVAGALFGALFIGTGNLLAPMVAHVTVNAVNLPHLARRYGRG